MKKNLFVLVLAGVGLNLLSGLIGAFAALHLFGVAQRQAASSILQTQHLEIVDRDGKIKATLGYDEDGVHLQMMSLDGKPVLSMSVLESTAQRENQANSMGSLAPRYPYGLFSVSDKTGRQAITIANPAGGNGQITFGTAQSGGKVTLGYFPTTDSSDDAHAYGAWGLRVLGKVDGKHVGTGIGILNTDGVDGQFLFPESPSKSR